MTGPKDKISAQTFELDGVGRLGSPEVANPRADNANKEGSLLDSALFNLNIAHQYIDESKHLPEHRLVCFHYAVALLARPLSPPNPVMIGRARRYLLQAANWDFTPDEDAKNRDQLLDSHRRIVCEAF